MSFKTVDPKTDQEIFLNADFQVSYCGFFIQRVYDLGQTWKSEGFFTAKELWEPLLYEAS